MKTMRHTLVIGDYLVLGLAAGITVLSAVLVYGGGAGQRLVHIHGPRQTWVFPLNAEETVPVPGPLGITLVELHGASVRVRSSPCTNHTCVAAGAVHAPGQWVACLPNEVMIYIEETSDPAVDGVAW